jgi:hypothetical protein
VGSFVSEDVALVRRSRWVLAAGLAPLAIGAALALVAALHPALDTRVVTGIWGALLSFIGLASGAYVWQANPRPAAVTGRVAADEQGITWNGQLLAPSASITAGFLVPNPDGQPFVRIERRWPHRPIVLAVPDEKTGRALLQGLGMDASQVTASFVFGSRARADPRVTALVTALLLTLLLVGLPAAGALAGRSAAVPIAIAALGVVLLAARIAIELLPVWLTVGVDGVLVSRLGRRRFIRYEEVRAVRPFGRGATQGVSLWLASGEAIKLPLRRHVSEAHSRQQIGLVMERIREGMASSRAGRGAGEVVLPEQGDRPTAAWVSALRALGGGANADHRTAPVEPERLWRIVEDPSAAPPLRGAAAVALGGALDSDGRARLRISAQATASPEMRDLLELAAEDAAEAELGEALTRLGRRA